MIKINNTELSDEDINNLVKQFCEGDEQITEEMFLEFCKKYSINHRLIKPNMVYTQEYRMNRLNFEELNGRVYIYWG